MLSAARMRRLDLRPDALLPVDTARRGGAGGGADTTSAEVKAVHCSSSLFGYNMSSTCPIGEGACWSFLGPAHSLEVEVEVGELERKMPARKPPKLPPAFAGVDDGAHVLTGVESLAEGLLFRRRFTAVRSSSLSLKATVPAVDRDSPESLNDSTVMLLLQDALEMSIADRHLWLDSWKFGGLLGGEVVMRPRASLCSPLCPCLRLCACGSSSCSYRKTTFRDAIFSLSF